MAMADYRLCDVCGNKAFYDANLNYDNKASELVRNENYSLDHLGDWAVICIKCAKTHKTMIVEIQ